MARALLGLAVLLVVAAGVAQGAGVDAPAPLLLLVAAFVVAVASRIAGRTTSERHGHRSG